MIRDDAPILFHQPGYSLTSYFIGHTATGLGVLEDMEHVSVTNEENNFMMFWNEAIAGG